MGTRIVFHIDFDYFYAQCEEIRNPDLKDKPVCVCVFSDRGGDSGAIATANYNARKFGVKSGLPISFAKSRLDDQKDAVFLPVDFDYYMDISDKAMEIMKSKSDIFEYVGKDEAYLDVSKRVNFDWNKAKELAQEIKIEIKEKLNLTCSIGISPNKLISKIASDFQKPDGLTIVYPEKVNEFLDPLKIREIPGIGNKTEEKLSEMNFSTIKDLKELDVFALNKEFGRKSGTYIYNAVRGIDNSPVKTREPNTQFSKIMTMKMDSTDFDFILSNLSELCKEVHQVVLNKNQMFKSIGIHLIQSDLSNKTKSKTIKNPTSSLEELEKNVEQLLREALEDQKLPIRRVGVKVSDLSDLREQSSLTNYF
ncbi:MAG: DNA polymerase IV [Nitrosopumilaceae archaeon]|nr:DNA polymerase IV [Nitrosopumilaceae archaeon]NIP09533.1 DNA polymerase IV [Nitrosopumilaceae archaeon]NIS95581.1 DNA polymerase IV [Nitrosopumilaceae archaeon]